MFTGQHLTTIQEKCIELDMIRKDGTKYDEQRFNTLIFDALKKTNCADFFTDVKTLQSQWIKQPEKFDAQQSISDMTNLYINHKSTGIWDAQGIESQAQIIALATALQQATSKSKTTKPRVTQKIEKGPRKTGILEKWHFSKQHKYVTVDKVKYVLFLYHGCKNKQKIKLGIYMPEPHDH